MTSAEVRTVAILTTCKLLFSIFIAFQRLCQTIRWVSNQIAPRKSDFEPSLYSHSKSLLSPNYLTIVAKLRLACQGSQLTAPSA